MFPNTTWTGWLTRTCGAFVVWAAGLVTAFQSAKSSIPKPPAEPGLAEVAQWAASGSDPFALVAAIASGLGLVAAAFQLFGPKPYSAKQGLLDRVHQNDSFQAAEGQQAGRHGADMAAHQRTHAEVAELQAKVDRLIATVARDSPATAGPFGEALNELAGSSEPADVAIAEQAVSQSPEAAADRLMAEVGDGKRREADRARQAARLYAPSAPSKAKAAYEEAVALDPGDFWSWIELGRLRAVYDSLKAARNCFGAALQHVANERDRMVVHGAFGNLLNTEGQLGEARDEFSAALAIAEGLAAREPGNSQWQRDLSISHNKLGVIEATAGNLDAARTRYAASLAIRETLAARTRYAASLAIFETLAAREPGNSEWQRDLSVSHIKLGDIERTAGNLDVARTRFAASLAIAETLAAREPGNSAWQRDLSVSHERLGDLAEAAGELDEALASYRRAEPIARKLAEDWPDHPQFTSDLAITRRRIAALQAKTG